MSFLCYLFLTLSRMTFDKSKSFNKALVHLWNYIIGWGSQHTCEAIYNYGRTMAQVG